MRVALAQIRLDRRSRSARIQDVMSAVDRAAGAEPAPDLVVLPGGCDSDLSANAIVNRTLLEAIAGKAREWGLYIAAGVQGANGQTAWAVLVDADGDQVACTLDSSSPKPGFDAPTIAFHESPYGAIGIVDAGSIEQGLACEATTHRDVIVAVPVPDRAEKLSATARRNIDSFLLPPPEENAAHWAVVLPAEQPSGHRAESVLWAPGGKPLGAANSSDETIVFVDVPVVPGNAR